MKGIMCSKFKVVVALLFLSCVLRRFFSLDKNSKKKKPLAQVVGFGSSYCDAVSIFLGYHRKMNKSQPNNCFHELHYHYLGGQGFENILITPYFITVTPATHTHVSPRFIN